MVEVLAVDKSFKVATRTKVVIMLASKKSEAIEEVDLEQAADKLVKVTRNWVKEATQYF
jgi:hypothetical protein